MTGLVKTLLQEQEKRVRLEEELKSYQQINKLFEEEKEEYKKQTKELKNINGQLKHLLTWYKFDKRDLDLIIDNNIWVMDWNKKPEIQKIREEITKKRFKCEDYLESLEN